MPELPDVEVFKRLLDAHALRQVISGVAVSEPRILDAVAPAALARRLKGRRFTGSRRHGKHLLVAFDGGGWLTLHFGMTGSLGWFVETADEPPYDRLRLDFEGGGHLAYCSRRLLGRVGLADDAEAFLRTRGLGPDALDPALDTAALGRLLAGRRGGLKAALMDQALIAGIGNIYSDEILFQARLHPSIRAAGLDAAALRGLHRALRDVLETAIACGAGAEQFPERLPQGWLLRRREEGAPCPRCGRPIETQKIGGRTGYLCPACQPIQV